MHETFRETVRAGKEALFLHFDPDPQFVLDFMRYVGRTSTHDRSSIGITRCLHRANVIAG